MVDLDKLRREARRAASDKLSDADRFAKYRTSGVDQIAERSRVERDEEDE